MIRIYSIVKHLIVFSTSILLSYIAHGQELVLPIGHNDRVIAAVFSPDERLAVTGSDDGTVKLWDAYSGALIKTLYTHGVSINSISFSPHGDTFITGCSDGSTLIWKTTTGEIVRKLDGHCRNINDAIYSPDGLWIATTSNDGKVALWAANTAKTVGIVDKVDVSGNFLEPKLSIAFTADGKKLVVLVSQPFTSKVHLWELETGILLDSFALYPKSGVIQERGLAISNNGQNITLPCSDNTLKIFDMASHKLSLTIKDSSNYVRFSANGEELVSASNDGSVKLWNVSTGQLMNVFDGHVGEMLTASFNQGGSKIITGSASGAVTIWDTKTGVSYLTLKDPKVQKVSAVSFYSNDKSVLTLSKQNGFPMAAKIWDVKTGALQGNCWIEFNPETEKYFSKNRSILIGMKQGEAILISYWGKTLLSFPAKDANSITAVAFCPDQQSVMLGYWDNSIEVREIVNGNIIWSVDGDGDILFNHSTRIFDINFSPDGRFAITASADNTAKMWDLREAAITRTPKLVKEFKGHKHYVLSATFSSDGRKLVTTSLDETARIWDVQSSKLLRTLVGHRDNVNQAAFSNDGRLIITTSRDGTNKLWNANTGKESCSFFAIDSDAYFTQIPSGYYQCTPSAAKLLHYVTSDLKVISFEQLDVKYNRPDKVLEAIGCPDAALVQSYRKAYQKRIKRLGIDTTSFRDDYSVPEADFDNREAITFEQTDSTLKLRIKGKDSSYSLDRFNLWINESPLFGMKGISLRNRSKKAFDTTISVQLSAGKNTIETSIFNINGIESYRKPLFVNYIPARPAKEQVWFIGIGIDSFVEAGHRLQWSTTDIGNLSHAFQEKYGAIYHQRLLLNRDVTTNNVLALKQWLVDNTSINDKVIIAYSGHGLLSRDFDYFLSTYDVTFAKPETNGLPYEALESLLDGIPARKKLMLIDACHSGEVDKEELKRYNDFRGLLASNGVDRGAEMVGYDTTGIHLGMKNAFELMQQLFVNVGRSTGATIISAAAGTQYALEKGDLKAGVFTYSILEKLRSGKSNVTVTELSDYVSKRVTELTGGLQQPTTRTESKNVNWEVW